MRKFGKVALPVLAVVALLVVGAPSSLWATPPPTVPEIDPSSGMSALVLLAGAVALIRGRRKK
jgi:hypothetical protein